MSQIVPLISSGIAGPLGVLHLPRLWQKASLAAAGKLHADYPGIGCGYDQMTLDALGINIETFKTFIATKRCTMVEIKTVVVDVFSFKNCFKNNISARYNFMRKIGLSVVLALLSTF